MLIALFGLIAISVIGVAIILGNKAIEDKKGMPTFLSRFLARFDSALSVKLDRLHLGGQKAFDRTHTFVRHDIPAGSKERAISLGGKVKEKYQSIFPDIRGKRTFKGDRKASAFLEDIRAHQEKEGKGRIEDDSIDIGLK